jgi:hypothetical protein
MNYGYRRVKGDPGGVQEIPEVHGWPELAHFLEVINATGSPIESVGCEKSYSPIPPGQVPTVQLGSYIDVIFSDLALNDQPDNALFLASRLVPAVKGCEKWWGDVSFVMQRFRFISGTTAPWGMMTSIKNAGRGEEEARKYWGVTLERLARELAELPRQFSIPQTVT